MGKIKQIGTVLICMVLTIGFLAVIMTMGSYVLRNRGVNNRWVNWLSRNVSISMNWMQDSKGDTGKYAKEVDRLEKYEMIVDGAEETIEAFCTGALPLNGEIHGLVNSFREKILHYDMNAELGGDTDREMISKAVQSVDEFYWWLQAQGIDLAYVQLPSTTRINLEDGTEAYDEFAAEMLKTEITYINISDNLELLEEASLDASWHWMPKDALMATRIIVERLNEDFGYHFDTDLFDTEAYINALKDNETVGRGILRDYGYDYQVLIPDEDSEYIVTVNESKEFKGDFSKALLTDEEDWDYRYNGDAVPYHNVWRVRNGSFYNITREEPTDNDIKILILGDSYSWPIASYLARDVREVDTFHPKHFDGNVRKYIEINRPDIVLWMYQEGQCTVEVEQSYGIVNR